MNFKKYNTILSILSVGVMLFTSQGFAQVEFGAFVGNDDHRVPYASEIQNFENLAGKHISSNLMYWAWDDGDFPTADLNTGMKYHDGYNTQTSLHLVWEPWGRGVNDISYDLSTIIAGSHDSYIQKFAQDCRDWSDPVRLRFAHEMIDDNNVATQGWYPWQDRPGEYVQAWDHIYQIFQNEGATNVEFVWSPNHHSTVLSELAQYYPGQDKVDWLGMDGYNAGYWSESAPWGYWITFDQVFQDLYQTLVNNPETFGDKKMMIGEFASAEYSAVFGETKAEWIEDAFDKIKNEYGEIEAIYWFDTMKERDWRINSSDDTLLAFQTAIADPYFTSHVVPEPSSLLLIGSGLTYLLANFNKTQKMKGGNIA